MNDPVYLHDMVADGPRSNVSVCSRCRFAVHDSFLGQIYPVCSVRPDTAADRREAWKAGRDAALACFPDSVFVHKWDDASNVVNIIASSISRARNMEPPS